MSLEVIGAGIGRTGTTSLKLALEQLGFAPCHHMNTLLANPTSIRLWERAFDGNADWDTIFKRFRAAVSGPTYHFYQELAEQYPKAKVILTVRDAESWYASTSSTIMLDEMQPIMAAFGMGELMQKISAQEAALFSRDKAQMIAYFNAHNENVRKAIPSGRLLVFETKDGWESLCEFLGQPVPSRPFLLENTSAEFHKRLEEAPRRAGRL
jgi:hypothetical protein